MTDRKLDIFRVLDNIDRRQYDFYDSLDEDEKKAFVPFIITRWMSGATDQGGLHSYYLHVTNELVNKHLWQLSDHPELIWKMMASCGAGKTKRHQWIKGPSRKSKSKVDEMLKTLFPSANTTEIRIVRSQLDEKTFQSLLQAYAIPEKEEKDLLKEFRKELK